MYAESTDSRVLHSLGAGQADPEIGGWFKAHSLAVNNWLRIQRLAILAHDTVGAYIILYPVLSNESLQAHGTKQTENTWKGKRRDPVDAKHSKRLRIVAEHHGPSLRRAPP